MATQEAGMANDFITGHWQRATTAKPSSTKLVALEKAPLTALKNQAEIESAQISEFAKVKSQVSALADAAAAMSTSAAWSGRSASSSNARLAAAISRRVECHPHLAFTLDVDALAKQQSVTSVGVSTGSNVGAGTMTLRLGTWTGIAASTAADAAAAAAATAAAAARTAFVNGFPPRLPPTIPPTPPGWQPWPPTREPLPTSRQKTTHWLRKNAAYAALLGRGYHTPWPPVTAPQPPWFLPTTRPRRRRGPASAPTGSSSDVVLTVLATDTVATLAAKINSANAGVVATTVNDGAQDRLILRSKDTGAAAGFRVQTSETDNTNTDATGLSRFAYDPAAGAYGAATVGKPGAGWRKRQGAHQRPGGHCAVQHLERQHPGASPSTCWPQRLPTTTTWVARKAGPR